MIEENARVLVVDDDTDACNVLGQMVFRLGIRVETTSPYVIF